MSDTAGARGDVEQFMRHWWSVPDFDRMIGFARAHDAEDARRDAANTELATQIMDLRDVLRQAREALAEWPATRLQANALAAIDGLAGAEVRE